MTFQLDYEESAASAAAAMPAIAPNIKRSLNFLSPKPNLEKENEPGISQLIQQA